MNTKFVLVILYTAVMLSSAHTAQATEIGQVLAPQEPIQVSDEEKSFDLLGIDSRNHRLLGAHSEAGTLTIVDMNDRKLRAEIPVGESSGVAVANEYGKYFVGTTKGVAVVDSRTLKQIYFNDLPGPTDAMAFDANSGKLFVDHDDGTELWVILAKHNNFMAHITLPGVPELLDVDSANRRLYVNIKDKDELVVIDTYEDKIVNTWAIPQTHSPHGLALDLQGKRVFVAGQSSNVSVFSLDGKPLGTIDIGPGRVDQIAFDSGSSRLYVPSSGRLVVIDVSGPGKVLGSVTIPKGTHSVAVDTQTHLVWIAYAGNSHSYVQAYMPVLEAPH